MWTEGEAQLRAREKEERGKKGGRDLGKEGVRKEGEGGGEPHSLRVLLAGVTLIHAKLPTVIQYRF